MIASTRPNVPNKRVARFGFHTTLPTLRTVVHARFRLNVAGLSRPVHESSSDESLEEFENLPEGESPKLSFESLLFTRPRNARVRYCSINN